MKTWKEDNLLHLDEELHSKHSYKKYVRQGDNSWKEESVELPNDSIYVYILKELDGNQKEEILKKESLSNKGSETLIRNSTIRTLSFKKEDSNFSEVDCVERLLDFCNSHFGKGWKIGNYRPVNPSGLNSAIATYKDISDEHYILYEHTSFFVYKEVLNEGIKLVVAEKIVATEK